MDESKITKTPTTLYALIAIFCVFAIIAGIYAQFIENTPNNPSSSGTENNNVVVEKDKETIKAEFNELFENTVNLNGFDTTGIVKLNQEKEIIYSAYDINRKESAYEINIHIPVVNIKSEVANSFNQITQNIFADKATEVLRHTDAANKMIYSIDYVGYINGDILSVVIRSTLKDGSSAQRVIVQTYNYNLTTNKEVTLKELITRKSLNEEDVNKKIKEVVQESYQEEQALKEMGYNTVFSRDIESENYTVENSKTYFLGNDENLYVIYAYGNQNFTSEMDIVLFE